MTAAATPSYPSNPKLEDMLANAREDKNNWQVYGDWLLEQGNAWGEVIVQACAGKDPEELADIDAILEDIDGASVEMKYGAVDHLELAPEESPDDKEGEKKMAETLRLVLEHPAGHLIRSLTLGLPPRVPGDIDWHFEDVIQAMTDVGPLPLLSVLDMTPSAEHMDQDSWRRIGDISSIWKTAPRLTELRLKGSAGSDGGTPIRFGEIDAPHLKTLVFISGGLNEAAPKEIGAGKLPSLERLELYFGRDDYGNNCSMASLEGILSGKSLPKLQTLGLMNSEWEAELIDTVADSEIVKRIKHLDLSKGILADEGVEALIRNASKLRHLESINLDENFISEEAGERVKRALPNVNLGQQREAEDDWRYCVIGE